MIGVALGGATLSVGVGPIGAAGEAVVVGSFGAASAAVLVVGVYSILVFVL